LIGPEYESAVAVLVILAMAIIPSAITANLISKLNNLDKSRLLVFSGLLQIGTFFISFFVLVPIYGTIGAAISILVAYLSSSIFLIILSGRGSFRHILTVCLSVFAGFIVGYMISMILGNGQQYLIIIISVATSILVILASKNMTIKEMRFLLKAMLPKN